MKYVDRKKLGIELMFAVMSSITSQSNDLTSEETVEIICDQSTKTRVQIASMINSGIKTLTKNKSIDVKSYLNDDILELAKYPVTEDTMERLIPFFDWLKKIQRENELERSKSKYMINDVASRMDRKSGDFLRTYSDLLFQSITFMRHDDNVIMYTPENLWGQAKLVFPDVKMKFNGSFPLVGGLFWLEGEYNDNNRYTFTFMVDVEFGNTQNEKRVLQDRNWVKFTFECARPYMELNEINYGKTLADFGKCGHDFIQAWSYELMAKHGILGINSLSDKEKKLLPVARIFRMSYQLSEYLDEISGLNDNDMRLSNKVFEFLDDRHKLEFLTDILKNIGEDELYNMLNDAITAYSDSELRESQKKLVAFAVKLKEKEANDTIRPLYKKIIDEIMSCTAEFSGKSNVYGAYPQALEKARDNIEPCLKSMGFSGEFPHYRRRRGKKGEYISVIMSDFKESPVNGVMQHRFELAAAVKKLKKKGKNEYFAGGMPFDETSAEDCQSASDKKVKYTRLGGIYDNSVSIIGVNLSYGIPDLDQDEVLPFELNKFAEVASDAMKGKRIPRWYKKMRKAASEKPKHNVTFFKALVKYVPVGLYVTLISMIGYFGLDYIFNYRESFELDVDYVVMSFCTLLGIIIPVISAGIEMHSKKKRIWRY